MKIATNRLNKKIEFGNYVSVPNDATGDYDSDFVSEFTVHCAQYQRTQTQQYQLLGTEFEDTITVAVRSNQKISKKVKAHFVGDDEDLIYSIRSISQDASGLPIGYDLVMLKQYQKSGD